MNIRLSPLSFLKTRSEGSLIGLYEGSHRLEGELTEVNKLLDGHLLKVLKEERFTGKKGETLVIHTHGKVPHYRLIVVGLGKKKDYNLGVARISIASGVRKAQSIHIKTISVLLPSFISDKDETSSYMQALTEGALLGAYQFILYKKEKNESLPKQILFCNLPNHAKKTAVDAIKLGETFAEATIYARNLISEPASHLTPEKLANIAQELHGKDIKVEVLNEKEIKKLNMGAYLGVAQGSDLPPRLIKLTYNPAKAKKHVSLVGKAITFDSGGISIKPSDKMEQMKIDMAGGALVIAVFAALKKLQPKVKVTGIIPAAENMPSGHALRPGDIVSAADGKTIEIITTDAEGRLTLADALILAKQEKPDIIIDLATLTGAAIHAIGQNISALFANNDDLAHKLEQSASETGEKVWRLPLEKDYSDGLESDVADLSNVAGFRWAGAITSALFLEEFVDNIPWAHIDLSAIWQDKETPLSRKGATGYGARLLLNYLMNI